MDVETPMTDAVEDEFLRLTEEREQEGYISPTGPFASPPRRSSSVPQLQYSDGRVGQHSGSRLSPQPQQYDVRPAAQRNDAFDRHINETYLDFLDKVYSPNFERVRDVNVTTRSDVEETLRRSASLAERGVAPTGFVPARMTPQRNFPLSPNGGSRSRATPPRTSSEMLMRDDYGWRSPQSDPRMSGSRRQSTVLAEQARDIPRGSQDLRVVRSVANFAPDPRNTLYEICNLLCQAQKVETPPIPEYIVNAYIKAVASGAYFVKYSPSGNPHERFVALRVLESSVYSRQPYIEWSTHDKSFSVRGRLHLSFLLGLSTGIDEDPAMKKFALDDGRAIRGPPVVSDLFTKRVILPPTWAFTLHFVTPKPETLSLLALDETVFQCWTIVAAYFIALNRGSATRQEASVKGEAFRR